jgi:ABC-type transporter Mla MlaB component
VLRISVEHLSDSTTLRLDGKVVGPWVGECREVWRSLEDMVGSKLLRIDLRGVSFMDAGGAELLREIYASSGAEILADTPLTKHYAQRITQESDLQSQRRDWI